MQVPKPPAVDRDEMLREIAGSRRLLADMRRQERIRRLRVALLIATGVFAAAAAIVALWPF